MKKIRNASSHLSTDQTFAAAPIVVRVAPALDHDRLAQQSLHVGLGLKPVRQIVSRSKSALFGKKISGFLDHWFGIETGILGDLLFVFVITCRLARRLLTGLDCQFTTHPSGVKITRLGVYFPVFDWAFMRVRGLAFGLHFKAP